MGKDTYIFANEGSGGFGGYPCVPTVPAYGGGYGGFGGGWGSDGIWAIFLAAIFGGGWGGGFGGNAGGANLVASEANTNLLQQAILNNQDAVRELAVMMNTNENAINQAVCSVKDKIADVECTMAVNNGNTIHAIDSSARDIIMSQKDCCCQTQQNLLKMGYENQLGNERQTWQLTQNADRNADKLSCQLSAINQNINDKFCQLEISALKDKIDHYRTANQDLRFQISQDRQTGFLAGLINNAGSTATT